MKKVLLIALGLVVAVGVNAQDDNAQNESSHAGGNKMWIGGTAGFATAKYTDANQNANDIKGSGWNFGPTFGYMLNDKMAVGINFSIDGSTSTRNNSTAQEIKQSGYNFEPFFRYYFAETGNFKFYGDATFNIGGGKTTSSDNTGSDPIESKYGKLGFGIHPGMQYWFTDNWSMASTIGLLGYSSTTNNKGETNSNGDSIETVDSNFGIIGDFSSLKFSFFYHF